jgi:hypothetical protein
MTIIRTISAIKRLRNTASGNPRFAITFTDDGTTLNTANDYAFAYRIDSEIVAGMTVRVRLSPTGEIGDITPA